jgi:hypothetical protein
MSISESCIIYAMACLNAFVTNDLVFDVDSETSFSLLKFLLGAKSHVT